MIIESLERQVNEVLSDARAIQIVHEEAEAGNIQISYAIDAQAADQVIHWATVAGIDAADLEIFDHPDDKKSKMIAFNARGMLYGPDGLAGIVRGLLYSVPRPRDGENEIENPFESMAHPSEHFVDSDQDLRIRQSVLDAINRYLAISDPEWHRQMKSEISLLFINR